MGLFTNLMQAVAAPFQASRKFNELSDALTGAIADATAETGTKQVAAQAGQPMANASADNPPYITSINRDAEGLPPLVLKGTKEMTDEARQAAYTGEKALLSARVQAVGTQNLEEKALLQGELNAAKAGLKEFEKAEEEAKKQVAEAAARLQEAKRQEAMAKAEFDKKLEQVNKDREAAGLSKLDAEQVKNLGGKDLPDGMDLKTAGDLKQNFNAMVGSQEILASTQEAMNTANSNFESAHTNVQNTQKKIAELGAKYKKLDNAYIQAMDEYNAAIDSLGNGTPKEADKIQTIITTLEGKMASGEISPDKHQDIRDLIEAANLNPDRTRTASEFVDLLRDGVPGKDVKSLTKLGLTDFVPQEMPFPEDNKGKIIGVNIKIHQRDDGTLVARFNRMVSGPGDAEIPEIDLNKSGVLDMSQFKGMTISISADKSVTDGKVTLVNTENVNVRFFGPRPDLGGTGFNADDYANAKEVFSVAGSDKRLATRLETAGMLADKHSEHKAVSEQYYAKLKMNEADRKIAFMKDVIEGRDSYNERYGTEGKEKDGRYQVAEASEGRNHVPGQHHQTAGKFAENRQNANTHG